MRVALVSDLLDGGLCGMRVALDEFLMAAKETEDTSLFNLVHTKPFQDQRYDAFDQTVINRSRRVGSGIYWSQVALPRRLREMSVDLLWAPCQILPAIECSVPRLITVWDLAPMNFNEPSWSWLSVAVKYKFVLARALKNAAQIICHSRAIAEELMERFKIPAERISVVYPGLGRIFRQQLDEPFSIDPDGYILYVGTCTARKNLILLVEAYRLLMNQGLPNRLALLVGGPPAEKKRIIQHAAALGIPHERLLIIESAPPSELLDIYRGAALLGFPSLYEGFGLPMIEASAVGLAVVALNRSTMPEVLGENGYLVDEPTPESFALRLIEVLDAVRSQPDEVSVKAKREAARFDWKRSVRSIVEILDRVVSR